MNGATAYAIHTREKSCGDGLVAYHASLVKQIAHRLSMRLPLSVPLDDLIQAGMIGLLEAARNYNASQGASFRTYAGIRVRGAILDEIRRNDWAPRSVYRKARQVAKAMQEVENREGRGARDYEVAAKLGLSLRKYHRLMQDAGGYRVFSLKEFVEGDESKVLEAPVQEPLEGLQEAGFRHALVAAIHNLPERERLVVSLYYVDDLNLRKIGEVLEISESRVSQIHAQAVLRLRSRLSKWLD